MFATDACVQILKCTFCGGPLSVFPISLSINQSNNLVKNICGRCPRIPEDNAIITRNIMYEALAKRTMFPCRYKPNGCGERITPAELCRHEKVCAHRAIICPHTPLGSCAWQGSKAELLEHFLEHHQFLLIEDGVLEIDIVSKQLENYLMPFNQDLYIAQFEHKGDDALNVNLRIIGSEINQNRFEYYLSFFRIVGESVDTERNSVELFDVDESHRPLSNTPSTCVVQISNLTAVLKDPSTICCRIVIIPSQSVSLIISSQLEAEGDNNCENSSFSSYGMSLQAYETLQRELECPVCLSYFKAPVLQCVQGHSLCETCRPASGECPVCRNELAATRNFALENILQITHFNCKMDQFGCKFSGVPGELAIHEPNCDYCRSCPLIEGDGGRNCPWMGNVGDILQHCRRDHNENVLDFDVITYYLPVPGETEKVTYILNRYDQLFTLHFQCDATANCYWRVQRLGKEYEAKYAYDLSLITDKHKISMHKPIQCEFLHGARVFETAENGNCGFIMIPKSQLQPFINMDCFEYSIGIFPL